MGLGSEAKEGLVCALQCKANKQVFPEESRTVLTQDYFRARVLIIELTVQSVEQALRRIITREGCFV